MSLGRKTGIALCDSKTSGGAKPMKRAICILMLFVIILAGCSGKEQPVDTGSVDVEVVEQNDSADGAGVENDVAESYQRITQEEAMRMMEQDDNHVIVDVRRQDEYDEGHIPGAILIPNESIGTERPAELPDLDQVILVYCRSGNRSKQAAQKLFDMGYTNVYEFGGIIDWTGDVVTE